MPIRSSGSRVGAALVAVLVLVLGPACGEEPPDTARAPGGIGTGEEETPPGGDADADPPVPARDPVVGDTVPVGRAGGSVAVLAVEDDVNPGRLFDAGRGRRYVAVRVEGCSGPTEEGLAFEPGFFVLEMADGTAHVPGLPVKRPDLRGGEVPAGGCLQGWVTFTVPDGAEPVSVRYDGSDRIRWRLPGGGEAATGGTGDGGR